MKRKLLVVCLLLSNAFLTLSAQVSDTQVVNYAKQRNAAGADARTIGTELLSQGATREQLERVAANYNGAASESATSAVAVNIDRSRVNNGESTPDQTPANTGGRRIFGHDIFRSQLLSFEPNLSVSTPSSYALGVGDELIIDVYGSSSNSTKLKVAPDGSVTIPKFGPVNVSGMTVDQAQAKIRSVMGVHYSNATIKVSVGQTRTIRINVMGEVVTPGTYTLSAFATVFHALYMAGGINDLGTLRDVKVVRNGRTISTVDVYQYILTGRLAGDVKLADNDVIIVREYNNLVRVSGNVKRPMWYEMKKDESLTDLFYYCGGFTGDAYAKTVRVNRQAGDKYSVYTVAENGFTNFKLADQDEVTVGENEHRYQNLVTISGAVKRPGQYSLTTYNTVRSLVEAAGGLEENAQTNRAVLTRMNEDRTRKTVTIDLAGIVNGSATDVTLENEDEIHIASLAALNDDRTMSIEGEVFNPGTFAYADNTTIEDLITKAGGLRVSASLLHVEVSRRIIDPAADKDSEIRSQTFNFTLNKNLSIEGQNSFILEPYDQVYIRRSPVYQTQRTVNVSGEVMFAGNYTLKNNEVRLSDIMKEAGGLKLKAYAHNARLIRRADASEIARDRQMIETAVASSDSISTASLHVSSSYTVGIDLEKAMAHPGSKEDLLLRDGDQLIVPQLINTVKITGEVLYPNNVTYIQGKKAKYYINEAGGYTKKSIRRRAYVVYANGQVSRLSKGKIEPGCEIVVPTKPEKHDMTTATARWISIASTIATLGAVLVSAFK